jgi:hypothetical protein
MPLSISMIAGRDHPKRRRVISSCFCTQQEHSAMSNRLSLDSLDPYDRVFAAVVRQAIQDYEAGQTQRKPLLCTAEDIQAAACFLRDLGLLDAAGEVTVTEQSAV